MEENLFTDVAMRKGQAKPTHALYPHHESPKKSGFGFERRWDSFDKPEIVIIPRNDLVKILINVSNIHEADTRNWPLTN